MVVPASSLLPKRVRLSRKRKLVASRSELASFALNRVWESLRRRGAMRKTKKKIEFSSHTGNLALMRNCVRRFLEAFPFSERQRTLMVLGVDEACSNIIRHAYHLRNDQFISLSLEGKDDCVCLRLRDYGKQPQPESMEHRRIDLIRPGGLGLHLIRNAFDQVDYVLRSRGTELVLTKNLE